MQKLSNIVLGPVPEMLQRRFYSQAVVSMGKRQTVKTVADATNAFEGQMAKSCDVLIAHFGTAHNHDFSAYKALSAPRELGYV